MKKINFQLADTNGDILEEKQLSIGDGDKLIMQYDMSTLNIETATAVYEIIKESLENNSELFAIPKGIELQVLQVK